jgi:DNA mismatch repair protein MutL
VIHEYKESIPEPFESRRLNEIRNAISKDSPYEIKYPDRFHGHVTSTKSESDTSVDRVSENTISTYGNIPNAPNLNSVLDGVMENNDNGILPNYEEIKLSDISENFLSKDARKKHRIIGQLFKTYWLVEFEDKLFIVDQHAAHEKVLFERTMTSLREKVFTSQAITPPIVLTLDAKESMMLEKYRSQIETFGYEVEHFGGKEYMISAVPGNLFSMDMKDLFIEMLDDFYNMSGKETPELILEKVASMSCKAAVKGNMRMSKEEVKVLLSEMMELDNPYHCPHGRPTMISMTKYELEKKFKRIV